MVPPQAFYDLLNRTNTCLLGDMFFPDSPGHMIAELDNFLRMRHLGEVDARRNYLAIMPKGVLGIPEIIAATYPAVFNSTSGIQIMTDGDGELCKLAADIQMLRPELSVGVGLSHFRGSLRDEACRKMARLAHLPGWPQRLTWVISQEMLAERTLQYFRRRWESQDYCPWIDIPELSPELRGLLGGKTDKLALIHIRSNARGSGSAANAGTQTDPSRLIPTLGYLNDLGYTIVKIGREPYPSEWAPFSVINYSGSSLLNYRNDLLLLKAAKFVMVNASGFGNLPDILGTPMVFYGGWHIGFPPLGPKCVLLPSLMRSKACGRFLKFIEQLQFFRSLPEFWEEGNCMSFPVDKYDERPPEADEILASVQEAIALGQSSTPRSKEQERFVDLDRKKYFAHVQSRVSQQFLERFPEALMPGFVV